MAKIKKPTYQEAIEWLAGNDDCEWLEDVDEITGALSVSAALVADLFGRTDGELITDLRRYLAQAQAAEVRS